MKRDRRILILVVIGLSLVLVLLGPLRLVREFSFVPRFSLLVDDGGQGTPDAAKARGLIYPGRLVFVDTDGNYRVFPFAGEVALGRGAFMQWDSSLVSLLLRGADGTVLADMGDGAGYPVFSGDSLAMVHRSSLGFSWHDSAGSLLWSWTGNLPLVDVRGLDQSKVGVLDVGGNLRILDARGEIAQATIAGGSRIATGLGLAVLDSRTVAAVGGLDPQVLSVYRMDEAGLELAWSRKLESSYRRDTLVVPLLEGNYVGVEQEGGLLVMSRDGAVRTLLPAPGWIRKVIDDPGRGFVFILRDALEGSFVDVWTPTGERLGSWGPLASIHDISLLDGGVLTLAGPEGILALEAELR